MNFLIFAAVMAVAMASDYNKPPAKKEKAYGYEVNKVYHSKDQQPHGYYDEPYHKKVSYGQVKKYGYEKEYHDDGYQPHSNGYRPYESDSYHGYKPHSPGYGPRYGPHEHGYAPYGYNEGYNSYGSGYEPHRSSYAPHEYGYGPHESSYGPSYEPRNSYPPRDVGYKPHKPDYKPHDTKYDVKKKVHQKGYVHHQEYYEKPHKTEYDHPKPNKGYGKPDYNKKKVVVVKHYYSKSDGKEDNKYEPHPHKPSYGYGIPHSKNDGQLRGYEAAAARQGHRLGK